MIYFVHMTSFTANRYKEILFNFGVIVIEMLTINKLTINH